MIYLNQLWSRILSRADMVGSDFVSEDELTSWINDSIAELWDLLVAAHEDLGIASLTVTLTDTNSVEFSTHETLWNFYKLRAVDYGSPPRTLQRVEFSERNRYDTVAAAPGTYTIYYVPNAPVIVADVPLSGEMERWAEYIVVDCAIKARSKEESDTGELERRKRWLAERIEASAKRRDAGSPARVLDVTEREHVCCCGQGRVYCLVGDKLYLWASKANCCGC